MEFLRIGNRRVLFVDGVERRHERLSNHQQALLHSAMETLIRAPRRLRLYSGRPDASGRPSSWLVMMTPLLLEVSESGDDILLPRIYILRDPLEPI